jgi:hypothetical protein
MFKRRKKEPVDVAGAIAALKKFAQEDEKFMALLTLALSGNVTKMKAMAKTWVKDLAAQGAPAEQVAAVNALMASAEVAREVRNWLKEQGKL